MVVVYHSALPMWDCQSLKMKVYRVSTSCVEFERDVVVPIRPNSILKWFGFSEEGMLVCQDSLEAVRCYSWSLNEWRVFYSLEGTRDSLFIQHIEGMDIYGFRLEQRENVKQQPMVLPRSIPRKIPMVWP